MTTWLEKAKARMSMLMLQKEETQSKLPQKVGVISGKGGGNHVGDDSDGLAPAILERLFF